MKTLWFKSKTYGYGWYPATWQGWLVVAGFIAVALGDGWFLSLNPESTDSTIWFLGILILAVVVLMKICILKGEPLKWRWGNKK